MLGVIAGSFAEFHEGACLQRESVAGMVRTQSLDEVGVIVTWVELHEAKPGVRVQRGKKIGVGVTVCIFSV